MYKRLHHSCPESVRGPKNIVFPGFPESTGVEKDQIPPVYPVYSTSSTRSPHSNRHMSHNMRRALSLRYAVISNSGTSSGVLTHCSSAVHNETDHAAHLIRCATT